MEVIQDVIEHHQCNLKACSRL